MVEIIWSLWFCINIQLHCAIRKSFMAWENKQISCKKKREHLVTFIVSEEDFIQMSEVLLQTQITHILLSHDGTFFEIKE